MASEKKSKVRIGTTKDKSTPEKPKRTARKALKDGPADVDTALLKPAKKARKRASDSVEDDAPVKGGTEVETKSKPVKRQKTEKPAPELPATVSKPKKEKKTDVHSKAKPGKTNTQTAAAPSGEDDDEDNIADQTAALLKGFESSEDEDEPEVELAIESMPNPLDDEKLRKKLEAASSGSNDQRGVIYIGRIPHGFYEHPMREYFTQFGEVTRLRVARNKKTGRSKHYAFVEFASAEVADIVATTMNKYLMFGHILQTRVVAPEQVHPELWKGANKRFNVRPGAKIEARKLRLPMERERWEKRITRAEQKQAEKMEKLRDLGYEFEVPALKHTDVIPLRSGQENGVPGIEVTVEEETQAIAGAEDSQAEVEIERDVAPDAVTVTETVKAKKPKKREAAASTEKVKVKKAKKGDDAAETVKVKKARDGKSKVKTVKASKMAGA